MKQSNASKGLSVCIKPDGNALIFFFLIFFKFAYSLEHIGW